MLAQALLARRRENPIIQGAKQLLSRAGSRASSPAKLSKRVEAADEWTSSVEAAVVDMV